MQPILSLVLLSVLGTTATTAAAQPATQEAQARASGERLSQRLLGTWPTKLGPVTLQVHGSVAEALQALVNKTGWSLAVRAESLDEKVILQVKDQPALEALEIILEAGDLEAKLKGKVLVVREAGELEDEDEDDSAGPTPPFVQGSGKLGRHRGPRGQGQADRVVTGQSLTIESHETVGDAVANGGSITVIGTVLGDAVATGGSVTLKGGARVEGDAVAIGGAVNLEPGATLHGDAVAMGGEVTVAEGAVLRGDRVSVGGALGSTLGRIGSGLAKRLAGVDIGHEEPSLPEEEPSVWERLLGALHRGLISLIVGLLVVMLVPQRVQRIRQYLVDNPGSSALAGFAVTLGFVPLCVMLVVTIIGIALIPLAVAGLLVLLVVGYVTLMLWIGERLPIMEARKTPMLSMVLGLGVLTLLSVVPILGPLAIVLASAIAGGAVLLSRFGGEPRGASDLQV